jgi:hypothetical protein
MDLNNFLFDFVIETCHNFNIDESHGLKHSMDVYYYSNIIFESFLKETPELEHYRDVITISSILHDMCDKKYMIEKDGIENIREKMSNKIDKDTLDLSLLIISKLSYSYIKKHGYPNMGLYQVIYDIVGDADRLASYDFERCIIYQMMRKKESYEKSFDDGVLLFENRVLKYREEKLLKTELGNKLSEKLHFDSLTRINFLRKLLNK